MGIVEWVLSSWHVRSSSGSLPGASWAVRKVTLFGWRERCSSGDTQHVVSTLVAILESWVKLGDGSQTETGRGGRGALSSYAWSGWSGSELHLWRWWSGRIMHRHLLIVLDRRRLVLLAAVYKQDAHEERTDSHQDTEGETSLGSSRHAL